MPDNIADNPLWDCVATILNVVLVVGQIRFLNFFHYKFYRHRFRQSHR